MPGTNDVWVTSGPLGTQKRNRQLGRSTVLRPGHRFERILFAGGAMAKGAELSDGDALASAVTISCTYKPKQSDGANASVIGKLVWGTDGHAGEVLFDWKHGSVIQCSGSQFTLSAQLADEGADIPPVEVGAYIGYYSSQHCECPTRTLVAPLAGGAPDTLNIPAFAATLRTLANVGAYTLEYLDATGGVIALVPLTGISDRLPIPGGAHAIRISDAGLGSPVRIIFDLTL